MDPTLFLAAPAPCPPRRPHPDQIDAFYADHGTVPFWSRGWSAGLAAWRVISGKLRQRASRRQAFGQTRLRVLD